MFIASCSLRPPNHVHLQPRNIRGAVEAGLVAIHLDPQQPAVAFESALVALGLEGER